jgi:MFS transporter, SET family, sugar efflux transporter
MAVGRTIGGWTTMQSSPRSRTGATAPGRRRDLALKADPNRSSFFVALIVVDVMVGVADAMSLPYFALFLVDRARLDPLSLGVVLTARAVGGIAFGTAFGAWVDRRTSVAPLLVALGGSSIGYAFLAFTTNFAFLLLIVAFPVAIGAAAFSQSIALVKRCFEDASPHTANRAIGVLRASWSLAWAFGPAVGAAIVAPFGFSGLFLASGAAGAIALATLALVRARPLAAADLAPGASRKDSGGGAAVALAFAALALFHTALFMGSVPLPIVITTSLGGTEAEVGWTMSLCAAFEIVVMGALIWRPVKRGERAAIVVGFAAFAAYFIALVFARSVAAVLWLQIVRAIGIGIVAYLGIGFVQSLLPHRPGVAAALFSNSAQLGSVVAAAGVGVFGQAFGYPSIFVVCAILSVAGLVLTCLVRSEDQGRVSLLLSSGAKWPAGRHASKTGGEEVWRS